MRNPLSEFFSVSTRKTPIPLTPQEAEKRVTNWARLMPVHSVTASAVLEATRGCQRYQMSYRDALIWAVAKLNGVVNVLTEDQQSSKLIEGVRFINPFVRDFDLSLLGPHA